MPSIEKNLEPILGHGTVTHGPMITRYVIVEPNSPLLAEGDKVTRYDNDTVLVSAGLPTKPVANMPVPKTGEEPELPPPTQSEAVRNFLDQERTAAGLPPFELRPTSLVIRPEQPGEREQ